MAEASAQEQNENKVSKTFRLPPYTVNRLVLLGKFFKESQAEVIERAINLLDENKRLEVQREYDKRLGEIEKD